VLAVAVKPVAAASMNERLLYEVTPTCLPGNRM
jgi:hypothetical protein